MEKKKNLPAPDEIDWYGNVSLHHAVMRDIIDYAEIENLINVYPEGLKRKNQFGYVYCIIINTRQFIVLY